MNDAIIIAYRMSYDHPMAIVPLLSSRQDNYMMEVAWHGTPVPQAFVDVFTPARGTQNGLGFIGSSDGHNRKINVWHNSNSVFCSHLCHDLLMYLLTVAELGVHATNRDLNLKRNSSDVGLSSLVYGDDEENLPISSSTAMNKNRGGGNVLHLFCPILPSAVELGFGLWLDLQAADSYLFDPLSDRDYWQKVGPTIPLIDRAAQGLSKTPLIVVIGHL
eukprot:scaffold21592_cov71-Skeletonema_dohrnii-CCMP3373.AAC.1